MAKEAFENTRARQIFSFIRLLKKNKAAKIGLGITILAIGDKAKNAWAGTKMETPEFSTAMASYEKALDYRLTHGHPSRNLALSALERFNAYVNTHGLESDAYTRVYNIAYKKAAAIPNN